MSIFITKEYLEAKKYANGKYKTSLETVYDDTKERLATAISELRRRHDLGEFRAAVEKIFTNQVKALMKAKIDALLNGYVMHEVELTGEITNEVLSEVSGVRIHEVDVVKSAVIYDNPPPTFPRLPLASDQIPLLVAAFDRIGFPEDEIRCQVTERRVEIKKDKERNSTTVHIHDSNVANLNMGTQTGTVSATVQSNSAVFDKPE